MSKKERIEEKELINQIKDFRKSFQDSLKEKFLQEREEKHKEGEVFFKGFWIPKEKMEKIQEAFQKRGKMIFLEIHLLILAVFFFNFVLWKIFNL